MNLEEKVQALLTAANTATGKADTNLTDAVESLIAGQGGGDNPLLYVSGATFKKPYSFPEDFVLEVGENVTSFNVLGVYPTFSPKRNKLTFKARGTITSMESFYSKAENYSHKVIRIDFSTSQVTTFKDAFYSAYNLEEIQGVLDFSSATIVSSIFYISQNGSHNLKEVRFAPNTLSISITIDIYNSVLSIDSLISIANGLNETATGKTLTMSNANIAKCDATLGTVALDSTGTYHIFTEDATGTVTLTDFIVNVKGWTQV